MKKWSSMPASMSASMPAVGIHNGVVVQRKFKIVFDRGGLLLYLEYQYEMSWPTK